MWLMYHWLCGSRKKPPCPAISTPFLQTCKCTRLRKEREVAKEGSRGGSKGRWRVGEGGACRFMIIPKQMLLLKSLWIANRAACQESRNQNTSLWGEVDERREGVRWGSCFPAFVSTPAVQTFLPRAILCPTATLAALSRWRYGLNHSRRLKLVSVTLGVTAGKNLSDSAWFHRSHYLFHLPLKSFGLFCFTDFILSMNKSRKKTTTLHGYKISQLIFFFICLSDNKQEKLNFLCVNCENCKQAPAMHQLFLSRFAIEQYQGDTFLRLLLGVKLFGREHTFCVFYVMHTEHVTETLNSTQLWHWTLRRRSSGIGSNNAQ